MFQNKKILVLGLARSGFACCKQLVKLKCKVVLNDSKEEKDLDIPIITNYKDTDSKTLKLELKVTILYLQIIKREDLIKEELKSIPIKIDN